MNRGIIAIKLTVVLALFLQVHAYIENNQLPQPSPSPGPTDPVPKPAPSPGPSAPKSENQISPTTQERLCP